MKRNYFLVLITMILLSINTYSTTYTSAANGNWMNFMSWTPFGVPVPGDIVTITHQITLDTSFAYTSGSITIQGTGKLINDAYGRDLWMNGASASFTNNGIATLRRMLLSSGTFHNGGVLNVKILANLTTFMNTGDVLGVDSLYNDGNFNNTGQIRIMTFYNNNQMNNYGTIHGITTVVDSMWNQGVLTNYSGAILKADSATNNGTFTNNGTIEYQQFTNYVSGSFSNSGSLGFVDMTNLGMFINYGTLSGTHSMWNSEVFNNINTGQITLGVSFLNADSISNTANFINDGTVVIGDSYYNFNSVSGASTGSFTVQDTSYNSGTMTGSFGFCDATPPPTFPFIDWNFGSIDASIGFCMVSVAELNKSTFTIYPNPTTGMVCFGTQKQFVEVYTVEGKKIIVDYANHLNLEKYNAGLYYLVLKDKEGNQLYKEKLIKE